MVKVLVTGATGAMGRKLCSALRRVGHEVCGFDVNTEKDDPNVARADLAVWSVEWVERFAGVDVVIHLAATPWPNATWEEVERLNVDLTLNVYQAAVRMRVPRFIFASSNWVLGGHRFAEGPLRHDTKPAPINAYGASKLFGERTGLSFHRTTGLQVICFRIGACQEFDGHVPGPGSPLGRWGAEMWLSDADMCQGFIRAVEVPGDPGFQVLNLMSDNPEMRWDLSETRDVIGYVPLDRAPIPHEHLPEQTEEIARLTRATLEAMDRYLHDTNF